MTIKDFKPGNYDLLECTLINCTGKELDIRGLFLTIDIYEDLYSSTLSGEISINDSMDIYKNFPIIGQEKLRVKFRTKSDFNAITLYFYVYKSSPSAQLNNFGARIFNLSLVSKEKMIDQHMFIQRGIPAGKNCILAKSILQNELQTEKPIFLDECSSIISYTPAMHRPLETIMMFAARAKSAQYTNPAYVFYESSLGFNFRTIESLLSASTIADYSFAMKNNKSLTPDQLYYSVVKYLKSNPVSTFDKAANGLIGSTVSKFDPLFRTVTTKTRSMFNSDDYSNSIKLGGSDINSRIYTQDYEFQNPEGMHKIVVAGSKGELTQDRYALLNQYTNSLKMNVNLPGNSNLYVGALINLQVPNEVATFNVESKELAGKYIITALRHKLNQTDYTSVCELSRDSYSNNVLKDNDKRFKDLFNDASRTS